MSLRATVAVNGIIIWIGRPLTPGAPALPTYIPSQNWLTTALDYQCNTRVYLTHLLSIHGARSMGRRKRQVFRYPEWTSERPVNNAEHRAAGQRSIMFPVFMSFRGSSRP